MALNVRSVVLRQVVVLVVLQQIVVQVEDEEQLRYAGLTLNQIFREDGLRLIKVQILYLDLVPKLLWQI